MDSIHNNDEVKPSQIEQNQESKSQILTVKSEPLWDIESLNKENQDIDWSIEMDAKSVLEACKYVIMKYKIKDKFVHYDSCVAGVRESKVK